MTIQTKEKIIEFIYAASVIACGVVAALGIAAFASSHFPTRLGAAVPSSSGLPGIYNATPTDMGLVDGYGSALSTDNAGRLLASPFSYQATSASGLVRVKTVAGVLRSVTITNLAASTPAFVIYDNTTGTGSVIASFAASSTEGTYFLDAAFSTGLTAAVSSTGSPNLTFSYR